MNCREVLSVTAASVVIVALVSSTGLAREDTKALLKPVRSIYVDRAWSGAPVGFRLSTKGDKQYVAYYNAYREMVVASRSLASEKWTYHKIGEVVGWDSHNSITIESDPEGYIHLSGNMHGVPLKYYRTTKPGDITTFTHIPSMTGQNEQRVTYPRFFKDPEGDLRFAYRDGGSGNGQEIVNTYDAKTQKWSRLISKPLFDGQNKVSAYYTGPLQDRKGVYHLAWCWRDTGDCQTNHDVCYVKSPDYVSYFKSDSVPVELPLTMDNAEIVDPIPIKSGLLNRVSLSFDSKDRPLVSYMKFDEQGATQIWTARREDKGWNIYRTTDWKDRWYFSGGGTIPMMIIYDAPRVWSKGILSQIYTNKYISSNTFIRFLDEDTLQQIGEPVRLYPPELEREGKRSVNTWQVNLQGLSLSALRKEKRAWVLRWASAEANRDQPRKRIPSPSRLEVIEIGLDEEADIAGGTNHPDQHGEPVSLQ